jgi:hypothetical protein
VTGEPWIEEVPRASGVKHRARWREPGRRSPRNGPVFDSREEVETWLLTSDLAGPTKITDLIERWCQAQQWSRHAVKAQTQLLALLKATGWVHLPQISRRGLEGWNVARGGTGLRVPGTHATHTITYLLALLRWVQENKIATIPMDLLTLKPPRKPRQADKRLLTDAEIHAIRDASWHYGKRSAALIDYLLAYGAGAKMAAEFTRSDINPHKPALRVNKRKHSGGWWHPITETQADAWLALNPDGGPNDPLFPHYKEDRSWRAEKDEISSWYHGTIAKRVQLDKEVAGIRALKRWSITRMLAKLGDPNLVTKFTGHLTVSQVLRYAATNEEEALRALEKICTPEMAHSVQGQSS